MYQNFSFYLLLFLLSATILQHIFYNIMNVTSKKLPKAQVELTIEVSAEELKKYRKQAVENIGKQTDISGFRKGSIPEKIIVEKYGEGAIMAEAADIAIPKLLTNALVQEGISPLTRPNIEVKSMNPFSFVATITTFPEVKIEGWEKAGVAKKEVVIKKKEIEEVIEQLRERFMERKPVERKAKNGDFVEIDFEGKTPDGVPLDGTQSKRHPVVLGQGSLLPEFEKNIVGMKKGEEKTFEMKFPKDYGPAHIKGKDVVFTVKLLDVFEQVKPEVNEVFIEKVFGKKMSTEEMNKEIEKMLKEKGEEEERTRREDELINKWADMAEVEMPDVFVDEEMENFVQVMKQRAGMAGVVWEDYLKNMKKTEEEYKKEMRPEAKKRAKQRIVMNTIINKANITVDDTEVEAATMAAAHAGHHHAPGEACSHEEKKVEKGSDQWQQAAHTLRINKLFDRFLGEKKAAKAA